MFKSHPLRGQKRLRLNSKVRSSFAVRDINQTKEVLLEGTTELPLPRRTAMSKLDNGDVFVFDFFRRPPKTKVDMHILTSGDTKTVILELTSKPIELDDVLDVIHVSGKEAKGGQVIQIASEERFKGILASSTMNLVNSKNCVLKHAVEAPEGAIWSSDYIKLIDGQSVYGISWKIRNEVGMENIVSVSGSWK
ncbi:hypothetical protein AAMO2058_000554300 [Amorphochlora amoebiformis]|uniref:Uncharacterized protein n=1 Tax=Amorphochlora amoebiformis TaxID=1561963 RepID=A0A7S0DS66_9EUKA|mmetsp:Transcript_4424/g.6715  ORF Transcript_4424/g.6715 Transcript_4424/m.6715 type:complete len:193 (+) Transcript_4424:110-688(+)|eukprot:942125-Amorphochlora_amoeboformis.AAC.1